MCNYSEYVFECGIEKGLSSMSKLVAYLLDTERMDELRKVLSDDTYREQMLQECGL